MSDPRKGEYRVPASAPLSQCRSCHAPIIWATTGSNKPIPLSVASIRRDENGVKWAISHFADCPHAAQHRHAAQAEANTKRNTINLRDLPDYMRRHHLVAIHSTVSDDGNGRLLIELQTRKE